MIDRRRRLKKEAEAEDEEHHEPIKTGKGSDASSVSSADSSLAQPAAGGRGRNDMDDALFASLVSAKKPAPRPKAKPKQKAKPKPKSKHSSSGSEAASDVSSLMRDPFVKPKSKAELYLEERNHKASRVARINQLEAKGKLAAWASPTAYF